MIDIKPIQRFIRDYWSDEKLAEVAAFNRAGDMCFSSACGCLLGVTLSPHLHCYSFNENPVCDREHYHAARRLPGALAAERRYRAISLAREAKAVREIMDQIFQAEIERRARNQAALEVEEQMVSIS